MDKVQSQPSDPPSLGVKGRSVLLDLPSFNIIDSFVIDYMHNVSGVLKKLFSLWLERSHFGKGRFYLNGVQQNCLNQRIRNIKPCRSVKRKPRHLIARNQFKANEMRAMILYYLPICLQNILPKKYRDHFMLLSQSLYILLKMKISNAELDSAEADLLKFVNEFQSLYGVHNMTMNIHLISHLTECVRNTGPLWSQSAFAFENWNGALSRCVNGKTDVIHQISFKYMIRKTLQKTISSSNAPKRDNHCQLLGKTTKKKLEEQEKCAVKNDFKSLVHRGTVMAVNRCKKGTSMYTSLLYKKPKNTIDYFVELEDGTIGVVQYYFLHHGRPYAMLTSFKMLARFYQFIEVQKHKVVVINAEEIIGKFLYMDVGSRIMNNKRCYIVKEPNSVERNL